MIGAAALGGALLLALAPPGADRADCACPPAQGVLAEQLDGAVASDMARAWAVVSGRAGAGARLEDFSVSVSSNTTVSVIVFRALPRREGAMEGAAFRSAVIRHDYRTGEFAITEFTRWPDGADQR